MDTSQKAERLSSRELQIAEAYAGGRSYRQIAEQLFIAPTTVRTHLGTIYRKLGVSTKIELLRALEAAYAVPTPAATTEGSSSEYRGAPMPPETAPFAQNEPADGRTAAVPGRRC